MEIRLPTEPRIPIGGWGVSCIGTGFVLPLPLIYLHQVRGIPLPTVGGLLAAPTTAPLVNSLADERVRGRANSLSAFSYEPTRSWRDAGPGAPCRDT